MPVRRTTNQTLLEEILAVQSWPVFLYSIQIMDKGSGTSPAAYQFTCTGKSYDTNEWQNVVGISDSQLEDENGDTYTIGAHAAGDTLTNLSGTPVDGDFVLTRWLYLAAMPEEYTGSYTRILYDSKEFLPFPVDHGAIEDHELGGFPQLTLTLHNPGTQIVDLYRAFERYSGMRGSTVYITTVFVGSTGEIYADTDASLIDKFTVVSSVITEAQVVLEMQSTGNLVDKKIPARAYSRFTCDYVYKDNRCKYSGSLPACNKLYSSPILSTVKCLHTGSETFEVPDNNRPLPDLTDCVIIITTEGGGKYTTHDDKDKASIGGKEGYIWRVASNTDRAFVATSDSLLKNLSDYVDAGTDEIVLSVIDKDCCLGHTDTGRITAPQWLDYNTRDDAKLYIERGNLLADGKFELGTPTSGNVVWLAQTTGGGSINSTEGGAQIIKSSGTQKAVIAQLGSYEMGDERRPEKNQHYQFYMQYYGYTESGSPTTAYISVDIGFYYNGAFRWYNWGTETWGTDATAQRNEITLRTVDYKTDFNPFFDANVKPDEVSQMVYTDWSGGLPPYVSSQIACYIGSYAADNVTFKCKIYRVGLHKYIPYEHAGRFPGIPLTRIWYV